MRPLTDDETKVFFTKLSQYLGANIKYLLDRSDQEYVFRLIKTKVYYLSSELLKLCNNVSRDNLFSAGVCFGQFSKSGRFRLHITALSYLSHYCQHKLWIKASGEQSFVYGNHILKAHIGRLTDALPRYSAVIVYTMAKEIPIGMAVLARDTAELQNLPPTTIVGFNVAHVGEYLSIEGGRKKVQKEAQELEAEDNEHEETQLLQLEDQQKQKKGKQFKQEEQFKQEKQGQQAQRFKKSFNNSRDKKVNKFDQKIVKKQQKQFQQNKRMNRKKY